MIRSNVAAMVAVLALASLPSRAHSDATSLAQASGVALTDAEKQTITNYFQRQYDVWLATSKKSRGTLPPALARKGTAPPGLLAQLAPNGTLPPSVTKHDLPDDLLAQLQPRPAGYEFVVVDDRVLLIETATNRILDIVTVAAADAS